MNTNGTNDSAPPKQQLPLALEVAGRFIRMLERASPQLAARAVEQLIYKTQRSTPNARERGVLSSGEPWEIAGPTGKLAAFCFGSGPSVILVHGWNGRGTQLGAFVSPLVACGYQVVMFDAPGHGQSAGSEASLVLFAAAIDCVIEALREKGQRVHGVIAHSLGAAAVTLSENRRRRAEGGLHGIARFVFIAPPIDVARWIDDFIAALGVRAETAGQVRELVQARAGHQLRDLYAPNLAREMNGPLLILHDAQDRAVPLDSGQTLAAAWPNSELVVSSGLGHLRILRDPAMVHRAVDFIRGEPG